MEKTYEVLGMSCVICKNNVEKSLNKINGVNSAIVNLLENEVTVNFDESIVDEKSLADNLENSGYTLVLNKEKAINKTKVKLIVSILLTVILMFISMKLKDSGFIQLLLSAIIIILNSHFYKSGFKSLFKLNPNMDSLVSLSSLVSYIYSLLVLFKISSGKHLYFETSAMVLVIVSIGKYIEGNSKKQTVKVIRGLSTLIPMQANLLKDDKEIIIPISELKKNDIVIVKAGESIPQDGVVIKGSSSVDESLITGESKPREITVDDSVIGGTVNINGTLMIKINKASNLTVLSNIINLTKKATSSKIPIERFADKISKYFVYFVLGISIVCFVSWMILTKDVETALNYSLSVLVISCPCALGLATPAAVGVAVGKAAKQGILIKKPEILEQALNIKTIIFDKTGTLTLNKLMINEVVSLDDEFIDVLSSLENNSNHPIALAIKEKYGTGNISFDEVNFLSGEGLKAIKNKDIYLAGNNKLISNIDEKYILKAKETNSSYIGVTKNNKLLGIVYLNDIIREGTKEAINNLYLKGIIPIMCTGDNEISAKNTSKLLGIKEYLAQVKPEDKNNLVETKKMFGVVGMVGDGINDSIALANSDISISIKSASDIASASSDVILMKNDLNDICFLYDLSKKTMRIIKQNLIWALSYNGLLIPIAAGVLAKQGISLNPMIGSSAMLISSVFVLSNALRINNVKQGGKTK